jgi:hypothetical protein
VSDASDLRVSDQDRERAVEEIQQHFAAGRLSQDDLDERVQAAYSAQTRAELTRLGQDLPRLPVSPEQRKADLAARRGELRRRLVQESGGGVIVFVTCTAIWAASGASGSFWPIWVALVCLIPLLRTGWLLYGPDPDYERAEQQLASYRRWNERHDPRGRSDARRARHEEQRNRRGGRRRY